MYRESTRQSGYIAAMVCLIHLYQWNCPWRTRGDDTLLVEEVGPTAALLQVTLPELGLGTSGYGFTADDCCWPWRCCCGCCCCWRRCAAHCSQDVPQYSRPLRRGNLLHAGQTRTPCVCKASIICASPQYSVNSFVRRSSTTGLWQPGMRQIGGLGAVAAG